MFRRSTRKRAGIFAGVAVAGALAASACMPADGTPQTIAIAGSDTTQDVMAAIAGVYNADAEYNSDPDDLDNVLSQEFSPNTVNGDTDCGTITYHTPPGGGEVVAPNGSSAGRNALKASVQAGDGCIDIARSSGPPRAIPTDLASFEYYAFALDALGWASASTKAPANLTITQLRDIYNCTHDNWSDVGGTAGPIQRYVPQTSSGTYQFFRTDVLTFDPALFSGPTCPAVIFTQENSGQLIAANGDQEEALVGYSAGNWIAQARGTAPDQRSGQTMRNLDGQNLVTFPGGTPTMNTGAFGGPVLESNVTLNDPTPAYVGIRYVFNVIDNTHVRYGQAKRFVGFVNLPPDHEDIPTASPLCDGDYASTIESFGFGPLDTTMSARNEFGSTCRLYTP
jgi:phosphate transport system substrate-binding protein